MRSEHDLTVTQRGVVQKPLCNGRILLGLIRGTPLRVRVLEHAATRAGQEHRHKPARVREIVMVARWMIRGAGVLLNHRRVLYIPDVLHRTSQFFKLRPIIRG